MSQSEDGGQRTEDRAARNHQGDRNKPTTHNPQPETPAPPSESPRPLRIIVSGGGSGGHISPILAVVEAIRAGEDVAEILYVGEAGGMESKIAAASGIEFAGISAGKFRRYHGRTWWQRLRDLQTVRLNGRDSWRAARGLVQAFRLLRQWRPDVIFISGGYVGMPVGLASRWLRIPYILHFADIEPGITRKVLAKHAAKIGTSFPVNKYRTFDQAKLVFTGNPIRQQILGPSAAEGRRVLGLRPDQPVVLVTGGSLGARQINQAVVAALPKLLQVCQIVHITGEQEIGAVRFDVKRLNLGSLAQAYHVYPYLMQEMGAALAAADVVVSRAGANAIAELALLGRPAILIPAAHLHDQPSNALALSREGAALVLAEAALTPEQLALQVERLLADGAERERLSRAISHFAKPHAAAELARLIVRVGAGK